jgi:hypothetical protein
LQTTSLTRGPGAASTTAIHSKQESDSSNGRQSSSLSKCAAAMPPPILKKSRGPSSTGPRPTARFISPHTSEEEDPAETSPTTSLSAHVVVRPPTPPTSVSKEAKRAEMSARSRGKAHGFVAATAANKRRPGVPRRPEDLAAGAHESASNSSNKDICKSPPEKVNEGHGLGISQNQLDFHEQTSPSPENLLPTKTSRKTRSGKSGHARLSPRQSSAPKRDSEHGSAVSLTLHGLRDKVENTDRLRPTGKKQDYISKGDSIGKGSQAKAHEKLIPARQLDPQPSVSSQSLAPRDPSSTLRSDKVVQHRTTERHLPKNLDGKSSISVAPTYTTATGETDHREKPGLETAEYQGTSALDKEEERSSGRLDQAPLFAKRPVQPPKSASALFASPTHQSNGSMSRSKSQLTLLLERDRAKEKENKERPDSASKTKDPKPR